MNNAAHCARKTVCARHSCKNKTNSPVSHRHPQQSGFTPHRFTCDRIVTLNNIAQRRQDYGRPTFTAHVDLYAAFDSLSGPALWFSCVRDVKFKVHDLKFDSGVRQMCVLATDSFATSMNWMLERTVGQGTNGVSFGQHSYTDLDFADDACLMAELLELLIPVLETMASEATSLGFEVNWQKTKVQALGHHGECAINHHSSGPTGRSS